MNMTRKLVTKRQIDEIREHPNADAIELAIIDGWQVVVKKEEFQEGDPCVFFEIDSFLPADDARFDFLTKNGVKKDESGRHRVRLRTVKLRKELSQGLALPWAMFTELHDLDPLEDDLGGALDVTKYERPEPKAANAAGNFPSYLVKTDEERVQNLWKKWKDKYRDVEFIPTLKLDGSSCTIAFLGEDMKDHWHGEPEEGMIPKSLQCFDENEEKFGEIVLCSRNLQLKYDPDSHFWKAVEDAALHQVVEMGRDVALSFAVQGEVMGPGVQGNKEQFNSYKFFAFNFYNITDGFYFDYWDAQLSFSYFNIKAVPSYEPLYPFRDFDTLDELLAYADGPSINAKYREGVVFKSIGVEPPVSFKAISNKWLLKMED